MDGISAVVFQIINVGSVRGVGSAVPVIFSTLLGQTCYLPRMRFFFFFSVDEALGMVAVTPLCWRCLLEGIFRHGSRHALVLVMCFSPSFQIMFVADGMRAHLEAGLSG